MLNKSDIIYSLIGFFSIVIIISICFSSSSDYSCPNDDYILKNKKCYTEQNLNYNGLKCDNDGYFNGEKCVETKSSTKIKFNEICSLKGEDIVNYGHVVETEKFEKNNYCAYNIAYIPRSNVSCDYGYQFDDKEFKCKMEIQSNPLLNENKEYYCDTDKILIGDKCIYYEYKDPIVTVCPEGDTLIENRCVKEYVDTTIVCKKGSYSDNACKILGTKLYSICPAGYIDNGYGCSLKQTIRATRNKKN